MRAMMPLQSGPPCGCVGDKHLQCPSPFVQNPCLLIKFSLHFHVSTLSQWASWLYKNWALQTEFMSWSMWRLCSQDAGKTRCLVLVCISWCLQPSQAPQNKQGACPGGALLCPFFEAPKISNSASPHHMEFMSFLAGSLRILWKEDFPKEEVTEA